MGVVNTNVQRLGRVALLTAAVAGIVVGKARARSGADGDFDLYLPIARAAWHNARLCGG